MENLDVARIFNEVADLLEIQGANTFRIRAYRAAARTLETLPTPVAALVAAQPEALEELPGIGADLASKIVTIVKTGRLPLLRELSRKTPATLTALMRIPGLGPKRARLIFDTLGVKTLPQLEKAARAGRLREVKGLGPALEQTILRGLGQEKAHAARVRIDQAEAYVRPLLEHLHGAPGIRSLEVAGSYRRRRETVGDIDLLVCSTRPAPIAERFVSSPGVRQVTARGDTRCAVVLTSGLQVDLRIVPPRSYGAALYYFTGSKAHNIAVRRLAVKRHLKINEYGVFRGSRQIAGKTEAEVFRTVGLPWIPPELREDRGEIDAARDGRLPRLVELEDIRGDLQMHTVHTDGHETVEAMARACRARGYRYLAITDHTKAVRVAGGLSPAGFRALFRDIERAQKAVPDITIFKSAEVDILEDGSLDLDEATLAELDVVLVSVHSKFNLSRAAMTRRILKALAHPRVHILGHPTGRLIGRREPYAVDIEAIVAAARDRGVLLEINAQPERLDLNDTYVRMARDAGVKLVISTDAHRIDELAFMRYGVDQARRGWCARGDIANTRTVDAFRRLLRR
ncbi:MAG: DNA polymerase/3'-5' exonuclease PolX [Acidobacteriota bacterium]|nr:DNA polymerase/3'-5' exonuclease PolX [Acidobacteriota bacterium]